VATPAGGAPERPHAPPQSAPVKKPAPKPRVMKGDEVYIGQTLNNRF
jgi:hypothetical protein